MKIRDVLVATVAIQTSFFIGPAQAQRHRHHHVHHYAKPDTSGCTANDAVHQTITCAFTGDGKRYEVFVQGTAIVGDGHDGNKNSGLFLNSQFDKEKIVKIVPAGFSNSNRGTRIDFRSIIYSGVLSAGHRYDIAITLNSLSNISIDHMNVDIE